jgi:two-component system nitrate/nitrite response regulator NarL
LRLVALEVNRKAFFRSPFAEGIPDPDLDPKLISRSIVRESDPGYNRDKSGPPVEAAMDLPYPQTSRVFVVSDVRFYREGLAQVLASTDRVVVLGTAAGTDEGLRLAAQLQPDVVLLDTAMADGVWMAHQLADTTPATRIVALAVPEEEEDLIALVEAGVLGYVTREQSLDEVVAAIISVVREEMACSPKTRTLVAKRVRALAAEFRAPVHARLTTRQLEILDLIAEGLSNKEIAHELSIEPATVKNHVHGILEKLEVHTRTAAVAEVRLWTRPVLSALARGHSIALAIACSPEVGQLTAILDVFAA